MQATHFTFKENEKLLEYENSTWKRLRELWKGKSAESAVYTDGNRKIVVKRFVSRNENYITLDKALHVELRSYTTLKEINLSVPKLLSYKDDPPVLIKEFIPGSTAMELLAADHLEPLVIQSIQRIATHVESRGWNIDYFPANFVYQPEHKKLVYIDYEIQQYDPQWNFSNWGSWYWFNHPGFQDFLKSGDGNHINQTNSFLPLKTEQIRKRREQFLHNSK